MVSFFFATRGSSSRSYRACADIERYKPMDHQTIFGSSKTRSYVEMFQMIIGKGNAGDRLVSPRTRKFETVCTPRISECFISPFAPTGENFGARSRT